MNDTMLHDIAGPAPLAGYEELAPARQRLMAAVAAEARPVRRRSFRSLAVRRSAFAGALAAGVVAAIVGTVVLTPRSGNEGAAQASPAEVLHLAAATAATEPFTAPRPDQLMYVKSTHYQGWFSVDGTHRGLANGAVVAGCKNGHADLFKSNSKVIGTVACTPDPAYLPDAPTDVAGMTKYLAKLHVGASPNMTGKAVYDLLFFHYLKPAAQAALFNTMATAPGIWVIPSAQDISGRPGIAVAWKFQGETVELIFDKKTHAFLGANTSPTDGDALLKMVIVDKVGQTS
jgi:hypothetical protein